MNAVLPTAPNPASGGAAVARATEPRAGRGGGPLTSDFGGQLAQALGANDASPGVASVPERSPALPQDNRALPQAAPAAQEAASAEPAIAPSEQPEPAQAIARAPDSTGGARRAASRDRGGASESSSEAAAPARISGQQEPSPAPAVTATPASMPGQPIQALAGQRNGASANAGVGGPVQAASPDLEALSGQHDSTSAEATAPSDTAPLASQRGRSSASESSSKAAAPARISGQQEPSPAPAVAVLPAAVPTGPIQTVAGQDSASQRNAADDEPVQAASPSPEQPPARHDLTTSDAAAAQDTAPPALPREVLPLHQATVAQPTPDTFASASSPSLANAPALPSSVQPDVPTPTMHAASLPAAPSPSPTHTSPPGPVAQMTPALVHVSAPNDGTQRITIRLDPVELGELHVRIERPQEGPVQVTVEATRPETLQLLRQDEPALHRALDQAGLPSEGRIVVLQSSAEGGSQRQGTAEMSGGTSSGGGGSQGSSRGSSQGWSQHGENGSAPGRQSRPSGGWLRAGVNITA